MIVGVEDAVSEAAVRKMLAVYDVAATVVLPLRGNTYLKSKAPGLNQTAQTQSVLLLTDLDSPGRCPASLRTSWLKGAPSPRLVFRVAVHEVEAWLLAHRNAFANFAGISASRIPKEIDSVADPKRALVNLCRKSSNTRVRSGIVPATGSTAGVGPDYNPLLTTFVARSWNPTEAAANSPSLARSLQRLEEHAGKYFGA